MLNAITDGISNAIYTKYPSYSIHIDEIERGANPPFFLIVNLQVSQEQKLGIRYWREHFFDIHYFPKDQKPFRETAMVATNLLMLLEYIKVDNALMRGTGMRHELVDGVLHFFVNYNVFVKKVKEPLPTMETLAQYTIIKKRREAKNFG